MITEKITTKIAPDVRSQLHDLFDKNEHQTERIADVFFESLNEEAFVLKYPQIVDDSQYMGLFVKNKYTHQFIQLLVIRSGSSQTILEMVNDAAIDDEEQLMKIHLTLTTEGDFTFSDNFDHHFFQLDPHQKQLDLLLKMDSWLHYIEFLTAKMDFPYTIEQVNSEEHDKITVQLLEPINWQNKSNLTVYTAESAHSIELGHITEYDEERVNYTVQLHANQQLITGQIIHVYNTQQRQELAMAYHELTMMRAKEREQPSIEHPLLNPFYPKNTNGQFFGVAAKTADKAAALEMLTAELFTKFDKLFVVTADEVLEQQLLVDHLEKLPIDSSGNFDEALVYYKQPIIVDSTVKRMELDNILSIEEYKIQQQAIAENTAKFDLTERRIEAIVDVKNYLDGETSNNNRLVEDFKQAITSYENEQEQLAFQNDQLIKAKEDIELAIEEQQQKLHHITQQKKEDQLYYNELENNWLLFNKESHLYSARIASLKNIEKSQEIIDDCQSKIKDIEKDQQIGHSYTTKMVDEFNHFKENQQIERIELLIKHVKDAAEYLNMPVDLQFATSYSELTNIYLTKYAEIEAIENRFSADISALEQELEKHHLLVEKPLATVRSYDRYTAEDVLSHVSEAINSRPLSLGVNYKAKKRWKDELVLSAEDMYEVLLSMHSEKGILEIKLMSQLKYAEQLMTYFEADIKTINKTMDYHQNNLTTNHKEYSDIIDAAKSDKAAMQSVLQIGKKQSSGRSESYGTLADIEATRKSFKEELMLKYESLESQDLALDSIQKHIVVLTDKCQEKGQEVQSDKEEMNMQMDVLQHDIVHSKKNIDLLLSANQLIVQQLNYLEKQTLINTEEGNEYVSNITSISENIENKEKQHEMAVIKRQQLLNWQEQLHDLTNQLQWKQEIIDASKLTIAKEFNPQLAVSQNVVLIEDQQYSWVEIVQNFTPQQTFVFVTDSLQNRVVVEEEGFTNYLIQHNIPAKQRSKMLAAIAENPFASFAEKFEKPVSQPFLVHSNDTKISS
ncbi:hypothetical protein [Kurthia sibirica]|uniref:Uncharacterized protein n=1 Tax=Kurthia sibirica TaxID=202750 RepID=A0A2U3ALX7_9BACL|nr:hypothetical protein [Kurthia sibirica]PWI25525.1 hypothetical protein DEX24_07920 [Kurthia sibirica]GEK33901.1 hypothetical protein KSI01_14340 [Kurthia sibirica]